ncbi:hypothetical protein BCR42DRAFT_368369 [Absidia repens]|uniref:Arrestin C-terminal-like domain-containing protein n=1 Tax=Absidia repens TaxID=90262 RepID=A0A1X2IUJ4_9FUNG|nr:hypothetical protein BCR42DRAFT_368369 [Absidia repens]
MSLETDQIRLSIQLQPELGWTIKEENVYGPGSVIQGQVNLEILDPSLIDKADRLRLIFHGSERTRNKATKQGIRRRQFFGAQRILWEKKNSPLPMHTKHSYSFTLQLPMIQFPPTINSDLYRCYFMTTVFLDQSPFTSDDSNLAMVDLELTYMPFIETCLFKTPLTKTITNKSSDSHRPYNASLSTSALDYVPGDTISMGLTLSSQSPFMAVQMDLYQVLLCSEQSSQHLISSLQQPLSTTSLSTSPSAITQMNLVLTIPIDTTPSFSFSDMVSVSYKLVIRLKEKKSGITGLLSPSPPTIYNSFELPIRIGTLGYGIRASSSMEIYSIFKTAFDASSDQRPPLPLPAFIKNIEYEESLPLYQSHRLPTYNDTLYNDSYSISISAPSPTSSF